MFAMVEVSNKFKTSSFRVFSSRKKAREAILHRRDYYKNARDAYIRNEHIDGKIIASRGTDEQYIDNFNFAIPDGNGGTLNEGYVFIREFPTDGYINVEQFFTL